MIDHTDTADSERPGRPPRRWCFGATSSAAGTGAGRSRTACLYRPALGVLLSLTLLSCASDATGPLDDDDPIATVTVTTSTDEIEIEGIAEVHASATTESGADVTTTTTITWSTSNGSVASAGGTGPTTDVLGLGPGTTLIEASAGGQTGSVSITVLAPAPEIVTTGLPGGEVGVAYNHALEAILGDGTFAWSVTAGDLPDGLTLDSATGEIAGTPTLAGSFDVTIHVTSGGRSATADLTVLIDPAGGAPLRTAVVNVDYMGSISFPGGETVYDGDDAVYSSPGADHWNGSDAFSDVADLPDEFGVATGVDLNTSVIGHTFIGDAANELQDHGLSSAGVPEGGFEWRDLVADSVYDLAFYVYGNTVLGVSTTMDVEHAGGTSTIGPNDEPTWLLPGEEGADYLLLEDVTPVELEPGVWGFRVDHIPDGGVVMGLQLRGPVRDH